MPLRRQGSLVKTPLRKIQRRTFKLRIAWMRSVVPAALMFPSTRLRRVPLVQVVFLVLTLSCVKLWMPDLAYFAHIATRDAEIHVWYIGYPSVPAPSTDLYAQSNLCVCDLIRQQKRATADELSPVLHATCVVSPFDLLYGSWRRHFQPEPSKPPSDEDFAPQRYIDFYA